MSAEGEEDVANGPEADHDPDAEADLDHAIDLSVLALGLDGAAERRERAVPASLLDFLDLL